MANIHIVLTLGDQYEVYFLIFRFIFYSAEVPYASNFCQIRFMSLESREYGKHTSLCHFINARRSVFSLLIFCFRFLFCRSSVSSPMS